MKNDLKRNSRKTASTPSTPSNMTTFRSGFYNTGISESTVEQKGVEDGQVGVLDPTTVGTENSHPDACDHLAEGHGAATGVIGHDLRGAVQAVDAGLESEKPVVESNEADALQSIDVYTSSEKRRLVQRQKMVAAGLPLPSRKDTVVLLLLLLLLFVGDWGLITLGFQIMGLPDRPWIPFLGFTDDLHLAALSSVAALVFLGDFAGSHIRRIQHALEQRRLAGEENRDTLPKPATFDFIWMAACLAGAIGGLVALSSIRTEYLAALGIPSNSWAFLGVQTAILAAAVGLGFAHANPEAKNWKSVSVDAGAAEANMNSTVTTHSESVGRFNGKVDARDAIIAQAGHHADTDAANVRGQQSAYKRRYKLSQLEPAQERLFGDHAVPTQYKDGELLERLTGITYFPTFTKVSIQKVMNAKTKSFAELSTLRARIDKIELDKLNLPELDLDVDEDESKEATEAIEVAPSGAATPLRPVPMPREGSYDATEPELVEAAGDDAEELA